MFVAEVGDPRSRREYNVLGDTVNTTARLMSHAQKNQIVISKRIQKVIGSKYECTSLGEISLKGKARQCIFMSWNNRKIKYNSLTARSS
jgi:class 3 adenylate cyclase